MPKTNYLFLQKNYQMVSDEIDRLIDKILINKYDSLQTRVSNYIRNTDMDLIHRQLVLYLDPNNHFASFLENLVHPENKDMIISYARSFFVKRTSTKYGTASINNIKELDLNCNLDLDSADIRKAVATMLKASASPIFKILTTDCIEKLLTTKKWKENKLGRLFLVQQSLALFGLNKTLADESDFTVDYSDYSAASSICSSVTPMLTDLYFGAGDLVKRLNQFVKFLIFFSRNDFHPIIEFMVSFVLSVHAMYVNFFSIVNIETQEYKNELKDTLNLKFMKFLDFVFPLIQANTAKIEIDNINLITEDII